MHNLIKAIKEDSFTDIKKIFFAQETIDCPELWDTLLERKDPEILMFFIKHFDKDLDIQDTGLLKACSDLGYKTSIEQDYQIYKSFGYVKAKLMYYFLYVDDLKAFEKHMQIIDNCFAVKDIIFFNTGLHTRLKQTHFYNHKYDLLCRWTQQSFLDIDNPYFENLDEVKVSIIHKNKAYKDLNDENLIKILNSEYYHTFKGIDPDIDIIINAKEGTFDKLPTTYDSAYLNYINDPEILVKFIQLFYTNKKAYLKMLETCPEELERIFPHIIQDTHEENLVAGIHWVPKEILVLEGVSQVLKVKYGANTYFVKSLIEMGLYDCLSTFSNQELLRFVPKLCKKNYYPLIDRISSEYSISNELVTNNPDLLRRYKSRGVDISKATIILKECSPEKIREFIEIGVVFSPDRVDNLFSSEVFKYVQISEECIITLYLPFILRQLSSIERGFSPSVYPVVNTQALLEGYRAIYQYNRIDNTAKHLYYNDTIAKIKLQGIKEACDYVKDIILSQDKYYQNINSCNITGDIIETFKYALDIGNPIVCANLYTPDMKIPKQKYSQAFINTFVEGLLLHNKVLDEDSIKNLTSYGIQRVDLVAKFGGNVLKTATSLPVLDYIDVESPEWDTYLGIQYAIENNNTHVLEYLLKKPHNITRIDIPTKLAITKILIANNIEVPVNSLVEAQLAMGIEASTGCTLSRISRVHEVPNPNMVYEMLTKIPEDNYTLETLKQYKCDYPDLKKSCVKNTVKAKQLPELELNPLYNLTYTIYDYDQRYLDTNNLVVQLNKNMEITSDMKVLIKKSNHPINKDKATIGWARLHLLENSVLINEIQTDAIHTFKKKFPEFYDLMMSAILNALRKAGVHHVYMLTDKNNMGNIKNVVKNKQVYYTLPKRFKFDLVQANLGKGEDTFWYRHI